MAIYLYDGLEAGGTTIVSWASIYLGIGIFIAYGFYSAYQNYWNQVVSCNTDGTYTLAGGMRMSPVMGSDPIYELMP